jgi:hypothetical protein
MAGNVDALRRPWVTPLLRMPQMRHLHPPESPSLPAAVIEQARAILAAPRYRQLSLFEA